jgi:membrane protease YdiL (CAAX protease family)
VEAVPVFLLGLMASVLVALPFGLFLDPAADCAAVTLVSLGALNLGSLGAVLFWVRRVHRAPVASLGAPRRPGRDLVAGIVVGVVLLVAAGVVLRLTQEAAGVVLGRPPEQPDQVPGCVAGAALYWLAPLATLTGPVAEEVFFRGFLHNSLRRTLSFWPAVAISSAAFGAVHLLGGLRLYLLVPALTVVGAGLAWVYERRASLLAPVAAHVTFNVAGYLMILTARMR